MNKLGVHALVWVGGWSEADATKAISSSAELGYDYTIPDAEPGHYQHVCPACRRKLMALAQHAAWHPELQEVGTDGR